MSKLNLAPNFTPSVDLMTQKIAILARTGAGKTNTATVIAEEVMDAKQQVVALDPKGDWWGLRSSADGKEAGYPITVLGGAHGDLPLEPTAGAVIADLAAEGVSLVIDLSEFTGGEMRRFVTDFAERFYRAKRQHVSPVLLILEEADEFCPQRVGSEQARMVGAIERLVKRARFSGVGTLLVTQRSASLNKDVLTQTEVLIVQQTTSPQDRKAIDAWVESHPDQDKRAELMDNVTSLKKGEAFVWSPTFLEIFQRVRFRLRTTYDAGRDVKIGEMRAAPKVLAPVDLAKLGERMRATVERAKQEDPAELRRTITTLRRELAGAQKAVAPTRLEIKEIERSVLKQGQLDRANSLAASLDSAIERVNMLVPKLSEAIAPIAAALKAVASSTNTPAPRHIERPTTRATTPRRVVEPSGDVTLGRPERAILGVLSQYPEGCTAGKLTLLTGYRYSGGFKNALSNLRTQGLIDGSNTDIMRITDAGLALGEGSALPSGRALIDFWLSHRSFGLAEKKILSALVDAHPKAMTAEQLCEATGYSYSGGFKNALSNLRTAGVIGGRNTEPMYLTDVLAGELT